MDAQSLFSKVKPEKSQAKRNVCCGNDLDDRLLTFGLEEKCNLFYGQSKQRFEWISGGSADIGFISAIDFAFLKGGWKVFPKICKSSNAAAGRSVLFFNKYLTDELPT